jgi:hypothetical protein
MPDTTPAAQVTPDAAAVAAAKATADAAAAAAAAKKPDGSQPADGSTAGAAAAASKAPDHYELSIPKGSETFVDAADLEEIAALAKENAWTNEEAQGFLEDRAGALSTKLTAFRTDTEADPVYGGAQLAESQQLAEQVLAKVRPKGHPRAESFRRLLTKTGIGNHIEMFSFLADLGKLMREDNPPGSSSSRASGKRSPEEVLYGPDKSA